MLNKERWYSIRKTIKIRVLCFCWTRLCPTNRNPLFCHWSQKRCSGFIQSRRGRSSFPCGRSLSPGTPCRRSSSRPRWSPGRSDASAAEGPAKSAETVPKEDKRYWDPLLIPRTSSTSRVYECQRIRVSSQCARSILWILDKCTVTVKVNGSYSEDEPTENCIALDLILYVVDDPRKDHIHSLNITDLHILKPIAHQNVGHPLLKYVVLKGQRLTLGPVYILFNLNGVFTQLFVLKGSLRCPSVQIVFDTASWRFVRVNLNSIFPAVEDFKIMIFDDFVGDIGPLKKVYRKRARISATTALIGSH